MLGIKQPVAAPILSNGIFMLDDWLSASIE
jgi:hypothetical protein